ncbi:50S ribosomal protein L33 [Candidatus Shikimatogenerans bostrichidophilus]|uniref:50S ribosomal protein L33 n=1 Tax=Candidatus Shikimatogenerans bostrichidophilus TaxID=2943807 RepID=UPI0029662296
MSKSKYRKIIILECTEQKKNKLIKNISRYYTTKNIKNNKNKLRLKKYNYILRKKTIHEEK